MLYQSSVTMHGRAFFGIIATLAGICLTLMSVQWYLHTVSVHIQTQGFASRRDMDINITRLYFQGKNVQLPPIHPFVDQAIGELRPQSTAVFVGVDTGDEMLHVLVRCPTCRVIVFDLFEGIREKMKERFGQVFAGRVDFPSAGLGATAGEMLIPEGVKNRNWYELTSPFYQSGYYDTQVRVKTLDEYVLNVGMHSIDLLRIDTGGAELDILKGMKWSVQRLKCRPALVLDISYLTLSVYRDEKWTKMIRWLYGQGYPPNADTSPDDDVFVIKGFCEERHSTYIPPKERRNEYRSFYFVPRRHKHS